MPTKPYIPSNSVLKFEFKIAGTENDLASLLKDASVNFELNKIPSAKFSFVASNTEVSKSDLLSSDLLKENEDIEFIIDSNNSKKTLFKGKIKSVKKTHVNNSITSRIECKDLAFGMTFNAQESETNDDTFDDKLKKLAKGLEVDSELYGKPWGQEKITHNASVIPWDFVLSYLDSVGILLAVKNGKLTGVNYCENPSAEKYVAENGINVFSFSGKKDESKKLKKVSIEVWDPSNQSLSKIEAEQDAPNESIKTIRLNDNNFKQETINSMANAILKKSRHTVLFGNVSTFGNMEAGIGDYIVLKNVSNSIDGEKILISGELHTIENGSWKTEYTFGLESAGTFAGNVNVNNLDPQAQTGQTNTINGLLIGVVLQIEDDPKGEFRIKVKIPALAENGTGVWARLATLNASKDMGSFFIPDVNDEVIIACLDGNPDTPVVLGSVYSSAKPPAYGIKKENFIKAVVTKEGVKLEFDDEKKQIELSTRKGNKILISDDEKGIVLEDENKNKVVMNRDGILIESSKDIVFKSKGDIKMESINNTLSADANVTVKGAIIKLN